MPLFPGHTGRDRRYNSFLPRILYIPIPALWQRILRPRL